MVVKTYVINLKESLERRTHVLAETDNYPFLQVEVVEAVNGKEMTEEEINRAFDIGAFLRRYWRYPVRGEIGCTLSHRICYNKLLSGDEEYALILEDDVSFVYPDDTELIIREGVKLLQEGETDMVLFIPRVLVYNKPKSINGNYTVYPVYMAEETCAYLVSRRAAKCLLKYVRPGIVADDFYEIRRQGVRIKSIYPAIANGLSTVGRMRHDINNDERKNSRDQIFRQSFGNRIKKRLECEYRIWMIKKGRMIDFMNE